jgi:ADP-ribose pyrophosphatase
MEIRDTQQITNERWLNLFVRRYRHNDHEGRWVFASRQKAPQVPATGFDAVVIVPVVLGDGPPRLALIREFRVPVGEYIYGFPAGLIEPGETAESVARRELREETGLEVLDVLQVSPPIYNSAGMTDEAVVMVFVTARATAELRPQPDASEDITLLLLDHAQVCELCHSPARIDGKTWVALYMYQQLGKLV